MSHLEVLSAQISRARDYFRQKGHLGYLTSAREIIDASAHCGQGVTLNDNQTRALALYLESQQAMREIHLIQQSRQPAPANVIRFSQN
jgi:hypothetical protein